MPTCESSGHRKSHKKEARDLSKSNKAHAAQTHRSEAEEPTRFKPFEKQSMQHHSRNSAVTLATTDPVLESTTTTSPMPASKEAGSQGCCNVLDDVRTKRVKCLATRTQNTICQNGKQKKIKP
jgi:hypothetical protein